MARHLLFLGMRVDFARQRERMVSQQLGRRGIRDPRLTRAMSTVPRERFVPVALEEFAYDDSPLPIAAAQTISQPYIVALMTEALELTDGDRVLEIGTGSGYAAAVLAELADEVFTVERKRGLADAARERLQKLGYRNVHVRCGDGTLGWPEQAPFDAIAVTAGGPAVPEALRAQLAVGGRLVIPVGASGKTQRLIRIRRLGRDELEERDLGPVRFVPLIGEQGWQENDAEAPAWGRDVRARAQRSPAVAVAGAAEPFEDLATADLEPLLERIGAARVILIGEATHGTAEFYALRARITQALIAKADVRIVAVEADWPDARHIDRFVRGATANPHPEGAFARFPTWMWANAQVLEFAQWLRAWNRGRGEGGGYTGFYGLDLYSMYTSIRAVLDYLDGVDAEAAAAARARYGCLTPWEADPAAYGAAAVRGRFDDCAAGVVRILEDLLRERLRYEQYDGERYFDAERNAALVKNAEAYYRSMYYGAHRAWNLRDTHMFETLRALLDRGGPAARAVVWAHNSHLGNAGATAMSARGETNLGELCRNELGDRCYAIGFGTDHGTVAAADDWGGPMRIMQVRPASEASYERICHDSGVPRFLLPLRGEAADALELERLERAIGVIYRPDTELASHYFHACLPRQFDEWIWLDETRAVDALATPTDRARAPDTFPFGV